MRAALNERCDTKIKMCVVEVRGAGGGSGVEKHRNVSEEQDFKKNRRANMSVLGVFFFNLQ